MADYTQIKASFDPILAEAFKAACKANSSSMASVLASFMLEYIGFSEKAILTAQRESDIETRGHRRNLIRKLAVEIQKIRDREEMYMNNIPVNLQSSESYAAAEATVDLLDQVLVLLEEAF
jgi:hypothetical protein